MNFNSRNKLHIFKLGDQILEQTILTTWALSFI